DGEVEVFNDATLLAVVKADIVKDDAPFAHDDVFRLLAVVDDAWKRNRRDAVLHRTDVLEHHADLPHDPLGHAPDAQDKAYGHRHSAYRDSIDRPPIERQRTDHEKRKAFQHIEGGIEPCNHPHLAVDGVEEAGHAFPCEGRFAPGVRKQFH